MNRLHIQILLFLTAISSVVSYTQRISSDCTETNPCVECDPRDCDFDTQCVGPDLLCADAHKPALIALGYDKRKAYCGANVGMRSWEVCFNKTILTNTTQCSRNQDCDDRDVCNGKERCNTQGKYCMKSTQPICDDGDLCTNDACNAVTGCKFTPVTCPNREKACDPSDGKCKIPFHKACDFLNVTRSSCNRTTTFVGFTNQTKIPTEIGLLNQLSWLGLRDNNLVGTIPSEIGNLVKLHTLNLHGNYLTGTVPSTLTKLTRLISLTLYGNNLKGSIPSELCAPNREIAIDCGEISCGCCVDVNGATCT
jgi:Dictyostelium (slime mold) repeat